ncbi:MAG: DegT/DnrJ/EryC1/StrS family aminotransferase [Microthrixaceae bacterium]
MESLSINRDRFIEEMTARNIGTSVHFIPIHFHPWFQKRYGLTESSFPVAAGEFHRIMSLPLHPTLSDSDIADVTGAVIEIAEKFAR